MKSYKDRSYISVRYNKKVFNRDTFENFVLSNETEILFSVDEVYTLSNGNILTTEHFKNGNIVIQDVAHNSLLQVLKKYNAEEGCVILMEVATGNIISIVNLQRKSDSYPMPF